MARYEIKREPVTLIWQEISKFKETYGGGEGLVLVEGQHLVPQEAPPSKTVVLFMHPSGIMNYLPFCAGLAHAGVPVMTCGSRYPHNDTALIMEKVAIDLGKYVHHAKHVLGYEKVVLGGWSGGGSLSMFYQSQAENPTVTETPAGDPVDLTEANLIPADGIMQLAAHVSRAVTLSEWIDASITDEANPYSRDPALDLYDPANSNQPPYSADFLETYRKAQKARMARITADVDQRLEDLRKAGRGTEEYCFVVHGTMADPRWLDPAVDPNDREPGRCYMGDPKVVNMSPAHIGRYTSLRSWLSQWSERSPAVGPVCAENITVPALVVENTADDACTPSHTQRIFEGFKATEPELHRIKGANHYYLGQTDKLVEALGVVIGWMGQKGLLA